MSGRLDLEKIRTRYQVEDGEMILWSPKIAGLEAQFLGEKELTRTEGEMLDQLMRSRGLVGLNQFRGIASGAFDEAETRFTNNPVPEGIPAVRQHEWQANDGHRDAFRHTYWNALMTREYGESWTEAFATAHEGLPGNAANREAMDLYNNEVGRRIARNNPEANPEQLAALVERAVVGGAVIVMDKNGELAWSDQVGVGQHGLAKEDVLAPAIKTPLARPARDASEEPGRQVPVPPAAPARPAPAAGTGRSDESFSATFPEAGPRNGGQRGPTDPNHPDHAMLAQIQEGVRRVDHAVGKSFDEASQRLSHCLLPECKSAGMHRVDHVVMGKDGTNVFAVQGQLEDPAHLRAHVTTEQAVRTPIEQSNEKLLDINQTIAQRNDLARGQEVLRQQQDQVRTMS